MDHNTGPRTGMTSDRGAGGSPDRTDVYDRANASSTGTATTKTTTKTDTATTDTGGSATRWMIAAIVGVLLIIALLYIL